jgi:hypothetical protein
MNGFSFEVPLDNLNDFNEEQDYIFALSFLCRDKRYLKYLRDMKDSGLKITLDNSYNELKVATPVKDMLSISEEINADYVICPDDDTWTEVKYLTIFNQMASKINPSKLFLIARNPMHFLTFEREGILNIAIPYEFRPKYTGQPSLEGYGYGYTKETKRYLRGSHFLGLNTLNEPVKYQAKSCDTSMPIKLAVKGISIKEWVKERCYHIDTIPEFFDLRLSKKQIKLAKDNINIIFKANQKEESNDSSDAKGTV